MREIRAAPERLAVRCQEHGQRPAPLLAQKLQRVLIDGVDIGAFLAVDLHVDIKLVHLRCDGIFLEAFMRHDVAPVTGRVADREQDGLVLRLRRLDRFGSPAVPVHRIFGMLEEIRTGFFGEAISGHVCLSQDCGWARVVISALPDCARVVVTQWEGVNHEGIV